MDHLTIYQWVQRFTPLLIEHRDLAATRRFFTRALEHGARPTEVTTDRAPTYPRVLDEVMPAARHTEQYANNPVETDHGRLKPGSGNPLLHPSPRLRPRRGTPRHAPTTVASRDGSSSAHEGAQTGLLLARTDGERQLAAVGDQHAGRVGFFLGVEDFDTSYRRMRTAGVEL